MPETTPDAPVRKKIKAKKTGCKCIEQLNKKLAAHGAKIEQRVQMNFDKGTIGMSPPLVSLEQLNDEGKRRRKQFPPLLCAFCPFCGIKLEAE